MEEFATPESGRRADAALRAGCLGVSRPDMFEDQGSPKGGEGAASKPAGREARTQQCKKAAE
jgi:hypothetical protein